MRPQRSACGSAADSWTISGSAVSGPRVVTARSRFRSADVEVSIDDTAMPAASATATKTATRVIAISVLDVRNLADDERADDLEHHAQPDHPQPERIGGEQPHRVRVGAEHDDGERRRHTG